MAKSTKRLDEVLNKDETLVFLEGDLHLGAELLRVLSLSEAKGIKTLVLTDLYANPLELNKMQGIGEFSVILMTTGMRKDAIMQLFNHMKRKDYIPKTVIEYSRSPAIEGLARGEGIPHYRVVGFGLECVLKIVDY